MVVDVLAVELIVSTGAVVTTSVIEVVAMPPLASITLTVNV